jgi:hypothetical protein
MKRVFCTLFVLAIAMVVGCGSGPSDTDRIGVSKPAQSTKSEPAKRATRTSTREATVPGKPLDDYARAMQPIEDKLDKLYERMNHIEIMVHSLILYQEGFQLNHRAFFGLSSQITILAATGQMDQEMALSISNDMLEADRKFSMAGAEWAKVQARYK